MDKKATFWTFRLHHDPRWAVCVFKRGESPQSMALGRNAVSWTGECVASRKDVPVDAVHVQEWATAEYVTRLVDVHQLWGTPA